MAESGTDAKAASARSPISERVRLSSQATLAKSGITTLRVERRQIHQYITANGVVDYDQTLYAQLSARVAGTVWRVEKQIGEAVRKGDVLAIVEAVEVGKIKAEFLQALVAHELKRATFERLKHAGGSVPERQLREAEADAREADIRLLNAQQTLVNFGLTVRVKELMGLTDDELRRRLQFLGLPASLVSHFDLDSTTANLVPLVAPFDGLVIGRHIVPGEVVSPGDRHLVVADVRKMWLRLDVRKEDSLRLDVGQEVAFTPDGLQREICSRIHWISTEVDERTRTIEARAEVDNPLVSEAAGNALGQRLLRANAFGTGRIRVASRPQAVAVPNESVQRDHDRRLVFVRVSDLEFEAREVQVGILSNEWREIAAGVEEGEEVAARGSHVLKAEIVRRRGGS